MKESEHSPWNGGVDGTLLGRPEPSSMLALKIMHEDSVLNGLVIAFFLIINSDNDSLYCDVYYTVVNSNEKLKMTYISNNRGLVNKLRCSHMINLFSH